MYYFNELISQSILSQIQNIVLNSLIDFGCLIITFLNLKIIIKTETFS